MQISLSAFTLAPDFNLLELNFITFALLETPLSDLNASFDFCRERAVAEKHLSCVNHSKCAVNIWPNGR